MIYETPDNYNHKSVQQVKADYHFNKTCSEQYSKLLLHDQSIVEANVERQSFPNLYIKFLFKKTAHVNYKKNILF